MTTTAAPSCEEILVSNGQISVRPPRRLWTVAEFEHLIDLGVFGPDERLELMEGEIIRKMTQTDLHAWAIRAVQERLRRVFVSGFDVRPQLPLVLGTNSRPEPDMAVVTGSFDDYKEAQPTSAVLVVEIANTTLASDRTAKAALYARASIPEYWIVNLADRVLEVHRQPAPESDPPLGPHYRSITRHTETETIAPLAAPDTPVTVADLLP